MTDPENAALRKSVRVMAQHVETIALRCRAVEDAITRGEMFGVPVPQHKIDRAVKDIETRLIQAGRLIGVMT